MKILLLSLFLLFLPTDSFSSTGFLEAIEVVPSEDSSGIPGLDLPLEQLPHGASSIGAAALESGRVKRLSDVTSEDASVTSSYSALGYWDSIAVRGFPLDLRYNYFRNGLPIEAETFIPLENKEKIEILKGTSGLLGGGTNPAGVVNFVVKAPKPIPHRRLQLGYAQAGTLTSALDVGGKIGGTGHRFNLLQEEIQPPVENANGDRTLLAWAMNREFAGNLLLEVELEWSRRAQVSASGFGLWGDELPPSIDPYENTNDQLWSRPVTFQGLTGSVKLTRFFENDWQAALILGGQNLVTDDHSAFAFGCSSEARFDRFCSDGSYDLYDFRSLNERRENHAIRLLANGALGARGQRHHLMFGYLARTQRSSAGPQAYNFVGTVTPGEGAQLPADPRLLDAGTNRRGVHHELYFFDRMEFGAWNFWLGGRQVFLNQSSERTDGTQKLDSQEAYFLPWVALSREHAFSQSYLSYGEGVESFVTPNRQGYNNPGAELPDARSRQVELGLKGRGGREWSMALFAMDRAVVEDRPPEYAVDGIAEQRGFEAFWGQPFGRWRLSGSVLIARVRRRWSELRPELNGKRLVNVPEHTLRGALEYEVSKIRSLKLGFRLIRDGERAVTPDNHLRARAWNRLDLGASLSPAKGLDLRVQLENLLDHRYWRETPTQYGHPYLFPGLGRNIAFNLFYKF